MPSITQNDINWALNLFPEDDPRHWELMAFLLGRMQYRALQRAENLRKREAKNAVQVENNPVPPSGSSNPEADS